MFQKIFSLSFLRLFSIIEGVSTLILFFVAMPLKYYADMPMAVTIVGSVHGLLFVALFALYVVAIEKLRIPLWLFGAGIIGAVFPFGPFVLEIWLKKHQIPESSE